MLHDGYWCWCASFRLLNGMQYFLYTSVPHVCFELRESWVQEKKNERRGYTVMWREKLFHHHAYFWLELKLCFCGFQSILNTNIILMHMGHGVLLCITHQILRSAAKDVRTSLFPFFFRLLQKLPAARGRFSRWLSKSIISISLLIMTS